MNPNAKPTNVLKDLITKLSQKGQTVFDFFSGGQVLKASLLLGRECIAFAESEKESLFLQSYASKLRDIPAVDKTYTDVCLTNSGVKTKSQVYSEEEDKDEEEDHEPSAHENVANPTETAEKTIVYAYKPPEQEGEDAEVDDFMNTAVSAGRVTSLAADPKLAYAESADVEWTPLLTGVSCEAPLT